MNVAVDEDALAAPDHPFTERPFGRNPDRGLPRPARQCADALEKPGEAGLELGLRGEEIGPECDQQIAEIHDVAAATVRAGKDSQSLDDK